jgi:glycosyltransferase 2 family protein
MKRSNWALLAKIAVAGLLAALFYRITGTEKILETLLSTNIFCFTIASLLMGAALALNGVRWYLVMRTLRHPVSLKNCMLGTFESVFFQQILPSGVGGDIARSVRAYDSGIQSHFAISGVIIDRAYGLWFVGLTLLITPVFTSSLLVEISSFKLLILSSLVIGAGAVLTVLLGMLKQPNWLPHWSISLFKLIKEFSNCSLSFSFFMRVHSLLVLSTLSYVASFYWCTKALNVNISYLDAAIIIQAMVLITIIPVSIGGWGLREGAALVFFSPLGIEPSAAISVSVLFGLVLTAFGIGGALIWFLSGYRRLKLQSVLVS